MTAPIPRLDAASSARQRRGPDAPGDPPSATAIPALPRSYVPRLRLWDRLNVAAGGAITMVVAPVGAGKTLGVAGWLRRTGRAAKARWVMCTPELSVADVRRLTRVASATSGPTLVVLDDADELSRDVLDYLDDRLSRAPSDLRVVLVGRSEPALTRLVPELRGDLTILRGDLLRLDEREVATLVAEHAGADRTEVYKTVYDRCGGWCAAVVLATRTVMASADPVGAARGLLSVGAVGVALATEAFARLTDRQRHLLLCVAEEPVVTPRLAAHLCGDVTAGRILEELESTGILVTRCAEDTRRPLKPRLDRADEVGYRLHPLLVEEARRRVATGGLDVERARATVARAVALDVRQGVLHRALRRLVGIGAVDAAVRLFADRAMVLVLADEAADCARLVRDHPETVERDPTCCLALAMHHWLAGEVAQSRSWLERLDALRTNERTGLRRLEQVCAHLMRARLEKRPPTATVVEGEAVLLDLAGDTVETPLLLLALLHLGNLELEAGRLGEADRMLTRVMAGSRSGRLPALSAEAASALALSQLLQGREHAALELATDMPYEEAHRTHTTAGPVREYALLQSRVHVDPGASGVLPPEVAAVHLADRVGAALTRVHAARLLLLRGHVADAERTLDSEALPTELPAAVRALLLVEQGLCAAAALDVERLARCAHELEAAGLPGEAAFLGALHAEALGDTRVALDLVDGAVALSTTVQPPMAAMARVFRGQLLDAAGRRSEAEEDLLRALSATEVRRNAVPFLGWSRHGTNVASLLRELPDPSSSEWVEELLLGLTRHPGGIFSITGPLTATRRERRQVPDGLVTPSLSSREQDVLHELARGATYADMASNLYLSENTVKSHVSSLYAKLAVGRRSDALAAARTLRLL